MPARLRAKGKSKGAARGVARVAGSEGATEDNLATGAPTKYNAERHKKIIDAVASGQRLYVAAALAGVTVETCRLWARRGNEGEKQFKSFAEDYKKADAIAEARAVRDIVKAHQKGDWKAAMWWLGKRKSKAWGIEKQQVELSGRDGAPIEIADVAADLDLSKLTVEELRAWRSLRQKAKL